MTTATFSHKQLAVNCFNIVWDLLDLNERTKDEEERMIHLAHVSFYHWTQVEDHTPTNLSIGYWQLSRVYGTVKNGERSLFYAERCVEVSEENKLAPFYIGYAYEALSRSHALLGQHDLSKKYYEMALKCTNDVVVESSKELLLKDLHSILA